MTFIFIWCAAYYISDLAAARMVSDNPKSRNLEQIYQCIDCFCFSNGVDLDVYLWKAYIYIIYFVSTIVLVIAICSKTL